MTHGSLFDKEQRSHSLRSHVRDTFSPDRDGAIWARCALLGCHPVPGGPRCPGMALTCCAF